MRKCDVAVLLTDLTNPYALSLHNHIACNYSWMPCFHVFTKADKQCARQASSVAPDAFFKARELPEPRRVAFTDYRTVAGLFECIACVAEDPGTYSAAGLDAVHKNTACRKVGWHLRCYHYYCRVGRDLRL